MKIDLQRVSTTRIRLACFLLLAGLWSVAVPAFSSEDAAEEASGETAEETAEVTSEATPTLTTAAIQPGEPGQFQGDKLTLNFQDIGLRAVLQILADFAELNLVVSDTVTGRITLRLLQVPWDQALELILKTRGLDQRLVGNVLLVAPAAELQARDQLELENRQRLADLTPLETEFIAVQYARAQELVGLFQGKGTPGGIISRRGSMRVDERTNAIIITDTRARILAFQELLERLDVPVRQVLIEARIVTASTNFGKSLGVRWGAHYATSRADGSPKTQFGGSLSSIADLRNGIVPGADDDDAADDDHLLVDLGASALAPSFAFGFVDNNFLLELELSALETEGQGEVIARPSVITADKQQAWIASGDQIPYQESSSSGATSVQFVDAVLGLKVTPHITPNDQIMLDLEVNQDSIGAVFNGIPSIRTNNLQTQVLVSNEETIVLGGVFQEVMSNSVSKTPVLGDLPLIGGLFRQKTRSDRKQELLIFITPKLIGEP